MSTAGRRLRIFVAHPSDVLTDHLPNGDGLISYGFLSRLAKRGHEVHVAAQRVDVRAPLPATFHVHQLSPNGGRGALDRLLFMGRMRLLYERLRRTNDFDLIHQMNPVFTGLSLALLGVRPPLVLGTYVPLWPPYADHVDGAALEGRPEIRHGVRDAISRLQQSRAAGLLIATPQGFSRILDPESQRERVYVVPHGVDATRFPVRPSVPARRSVLFLSHVIRRKGVFTLIEAFGHVAKAMPDAELVMVGGGEDLDEIKRLAGGLRGARVTFIGHVPQAQVQQLMHEHSVYCLPSYGEPLGSTVLEAMACGVPVVATRAGGPIDLVSTEGGRLVPVRDPRALAEALIEILGSPALQASMGHHNRRRVEEEFEIEKTVDRLEFAYDSIVQSELRQRGATPGPASWRHTSAAGVSSPPARPLQARRRSMS